MEKSVGTVNISYQVDCPYCGETNYSDVQRYSGWEDLEYGDGLPHGILNCGDCKQDFEVEIQG